MASVDESSRDILVYIYTDKNNSQLHYVGERQVGRHYAERRTAGRDIPRCLNARRSARYARNGISAAGGRSDTRTLLRHTAVNVVGNVLYDERGGRSTARLSVRKRRSSAIHEPITQVGCAVRAVANRPPRRGDLSVENYNHTRYEGVYGSGRSGRVIRGRRGTYMLMAPRHRVRSAHRQRIQRLLAFLVMSAGQEI